MSFDRNSGKLSGVDSVKQPKTDVEDSYGETAAPLEYVQRGDAAKFVDTVRTTRAPRASKGNIPTPKVPDDQSEVVTGTRVGPNSRGTPNTLSHNDDWHNREFGD